MYKYCFSNVTFTLSVLKIVPTVPVGPETVFSLSQSAEQLCYHHVSFHLKWWDYRLCIDSLPSVKTEDLRKVAKGSTGKLKKKKKFKSVFEHTLK